MAFQRFLARPNNEMLKTFHNIFKEHKMSEITDIISKLNLNKLNDDEVLKIVQETLSEYNQAIIDYQSGNDRALNFIIGSVMKKTNGKADAKNVCELIKSELEVRS